MHSQSIKVDEILQEDYEVDVLDKKAFILLYFNTLSRSTFFYFSIILSFFVHKPYLTTRGRPLAFIFGLKGRVGSEQAS